MMGGLEFREPALQSSCRMTTTTTHTDRYKHGLLFIWWRSDDATREEGSEAFASTEQNPPLAHFPPLSFWHLNSTTSCLHVLCVLLCCALCGGIFVIQARKANISSLSSPFPSSQNHRAQK